MDSQTLPPGRYDPDEHARLESERDFLLRSLDDIEEEWVAGNLDAGDYERLREDYTARAATVLRAIEEGVDRRPVAPPTSKRRKLLVGAAVCGFAGLAGVLLAWGLGDRLPGQTVTGNVQTETLLEERRAAFERRILDHPGDAGAHLDYARFLLEVGEEARAVMEFDTSAQLDPNNAEPLVYAGWLVFLAARQTDGDVAADLVDRALDRLDRAVAIEPDHPEARFFRGMVLFRGKGDPEAAVGDFERFLALVPEGPERDEVTAVLEAARQAAGREPAPGQ